MTLRAAIEKALGYTPGTELPADIERELEQYEVVDVSEAEIDFEQPKPVRIIDGVRDTERR